MPWIFFSFFNFLFVVSFYILKDGSEVKLILLENGWAKVGFDGRDGRYFEGWVPEKDITKI